MNEVGATEHLQWSSPVFHQEKKRTSFHLWESREHGQRQRDGHRTAGMDLGEAREREDERSWEFKDSKEPSQGIKIALSVRFLFKTSVWVLGVHTTPASLFVSHQGHNSLLQTLIPSTHSCSIVISTEHFTESTSNLHHTHICNSAFHLCLSVSLFSLRCFLSRPNSRSVLPSANPTDSLKSSGFLCLRLRRTLSH